MEYTLYWSKRCIHCQKLMAHIRAMEKPIGNIIQLQCLDDMNTALFPEFLKEVPLLVQKSNGNITNLTVGDNILGVIMNIPISPEPQVKDKELFNTVHPPSAEQPSITIKNKPNLNHGNTVRENFNIDEKQQNAKINGPDFSKFQDFTSSGGNFGESLDDAFKPMSDNLEEKKDNVMDKGDYEKRYQELLQERKL